MLSPLDQGISDLVFSGGLSIAEAGLAVPQQKLSQGQNEYVQKIAPDQEQNNRKSQRNQELIESCVETSAADYDDSWSGCC